MAPLPKSQLLWINQDVLSYRQSKRASATQAAIINAHSQDQARAARNIISQRALREGSAAKAIVGWRQRSVPPTSWSSYPQNRWPQQSKPCSREDSESNPKELESSIRLQSKTSFDKLVPSVLYICGKDEALDPFNCTAAKIDSNAHNLIEFYLRRVDPSYWTAKPRGAYENLDIEPIEAVTESIGNKAVFFSLLACTAAFKERVEEDDQTNRGAIYLGQALVAVREQVQRKDSVQKDSLHSIVNMAICADLLRDYAASVAHLRAAKFVVDQGGGLLSLLDPSRISLFKSLVRADIGRAITTLSCPVFICPWPPTTLPLPQDKLDVGLEREACRALVGIAEATLPEDLHEYVYQIIGCARMLHYVWNYPNESEAAIRQLGSSVTAIFYHLLSLSFEEYPEERKKLEATRVSLTIWTLLISQSLYRDSRVGKDITPVFDSVSLKAQKRFWPSTVYFLLKEWNEVVQSFLLKSNSTYICTPIRLVRIVQAIECETDVKLGGVMERLFELEALFRPTPQQIPLNNQSTSSLMDQPIRPSYALV